ncbi:MAG: thiamine pyrophosphate-dependent enzyme [Cellulosilyticaceae bacterium]
MAYNLKETSLKPERLTGGHRMCAGCGAPVVVRTVLRALKEEDKAVIGSATGCLEVSTFIYPYTAWQDSFIHSAFENGAVTVAGVEAAYNNMKRTGKIDDTYKFIAFGGDGGTYDIGLQSLSGAMERGHDMVYVCYDNGAYMNTGIQRSSATPKYADTTTSPAGSVIPGKTQYRKDLTQVMAAHHIPYIAQSAPIGNFKDLYEKSEKAIYTPGAAFLNVLAPCPRGWRYDTPKLMEMAQIAVDTCFWPLYEVENGVYKLTYMPKQKRPISDWLEAQGRFKHVAKDPEKVAEIQAEIDARWDALLTLCQVKN